MKYNSIGNLSVSEMAFGCEPLGGVDWGYVDVDGISQSIELAIEKGINFFDTADVYGLGISEERLSNILNKRRHDMVIATKVGIRWGKNIGERRVRTYKDGSTEYISEAVHNSLRRLRLDSLPICYLHWPDPATPISESAAILQSFKEAGKIRAIGFSNVDIYQLKEAMEVAKIDVIQCSYSLIDRKIESEFFSFCKENNISIVVYGALAQGLLTGKYINAVFQQNDRRSRLNNFKNPLILPAIQELKEIAKAERVSCAELALQWVRSHPEITSIIVGIKSASQLENNLKAFSSKLLSPFLQQILQNLFKN